MTPHSTAYAGIWKHSKLIIGLLIVLFFVSVVIDSVLWSAVHKNAVAQKTLNEIVASKEVPKTDEDKTKLLDALATAHATAGAQGAPQSPKNPNTTSHTPAPPSDQAKMKLLDSLHK